MNKYFVADSYKGLDWVGKPFQKDNGKFYVKVRGTCDRCGGIGVIAARVENDKIVPIPVDDGVCYSCAGSGYFTKDVRLYTEKEKNNMDKQIIKRKQEKEDKKIAEAAATREKWLQSHGFSTEGTYIVTGNTYLIKDELKEDGWKFDGVLMWHKADPGKYQDRVVFAKLDDIVVFNEYGNGSYKEGTQEYVNHLLGKDAAPVERSVWLEEEVFNGLSAKLTKKSSYMGRYGLSYVYTFHTPEDYELVWFTTKQIPQEEDAEVTISGKVKDRKEYKGIYQTIVTRCTIK